MQTMTDGGADYCFECVGNADVMLAAFRSTHEVRNLDFSEFRIQSISSK